jgi:hypothetical protein
MIAVFVSRIRTTMPAGGLLGKLSGSVLTILIAQVALGLFAYFVLLDESGQIQPSNLQVVANSSHMVIGALLFAATVVTSILAARIRSLPVHTDA